MIIDSHVHIGNIMNFNMPEEMVLKSMEKYNIDYSLVSNAEASEVDGNQELIPIEFQHSQIETCEKILRFAKNNPKKIGALLWVKPRLEGCTEDFKNLVKENIEWVLGIKIHPYHSKMRFDSLQVQEYIKLAEEYNLPILTHTANDECSNPKLVYEMAKKYKKVNFIMGHMGLGTDNEKAIEYIEKLPNLYGDTAWVEPEHAIKMIKRCGSEKLLFGTDNPIDGVDTYNHPTICSVYLSEEFKNSLTKEEYENVMYKNAIRLFNLKNIKVN